MTCERVWDLLSAYADRETSDDETAMVETHVAACSECARDLKWLQATAGVLNVLPEVEPPASLHASILAATVHRPTRRQRLLASLGGPLRMPALRYGALAGCAATAAWLAVTLSGPLAPNPAAYRPTLRTARANRPVPPAPAPAGESALFTARLDENIALPALDDRAAPLHPAARPNPRPTEPAFRLAAAEPAPGMRSIQPKAATTKSYPDADSPRAALPGGPIPEEPATMFDSAPTMSDMTSGAKIADAAVGKDAGTTEAGTIGRPMAAQPMHVALASYSEPAPQTQLVTLADLKRSLRRQAMDDRAHFITESIREKRIRLDVVRGRF